MQKFRRMHLVAVVTLALFSTMTIASMGDTAEAAEEPAPLTDGVSESSIVEPEELDRAVLAWMENETQMSIDPTEAPQGYIPDFTCIEPPHNCPAWAKCPFLAPGGAVCAVTSCGMGTCSACPVTTPGLLIKSWCAYGCSKGGKVVGGAFWLLSRHFGWVGPVCFPG